eukprot:11871619-Heterocapsa_arctica.AAC.1
MWWTRTTTVAERAVPYADFALFGPYGLRIRRRLVLSGMSISSDGVLKQIELKGSPCPQDWIRCYRVLCTALIMLGAVTPGVLDAYEQQICRYHVRYGPAIWVLLDQADVRTPLEHMERWRRVAQSKVPAEFDAANPWEWVWLESLRDLAPPIWRLDFEEPAILVITRSRTMNSEINGDAQVGRLVSAYEARAKSDFSPRPHVLPELRRGCSWNSMVRSMDRYRPGHRGHAVQGPAPIGSVRPRRCTTGHRARLRCVTCWPIG